MAETTAKCLNIRRLTSQASLSENTKVKIQEFVYDWNIENFEDVLDRKYEVPSPIFTSDESGRMKWKLVLFKTHKYPEGAHVAISLIKASDDVNTHNVLYSVAIIDEFGKVYRLLTREKVFSKYLDFDEESIISHTDLIKNQFFVDKSLKIRCEMNIIIMNVNEENQSLSEISSGNLSVSDFNLMSLSTKQEDTKKKSLSMNDNISHSNGYNIVVEDVKLENSIQNSINNPKSLNCLSDNLRALYINKSYSDVSIICEGQEIRAHKAIIAARSEYFKNICAESVSNKIILDDKKAVVDAILLYLYTGKMQQLPTDLTLDLLLAAKKFRLFHLQESVIDVLKSNITIDNITDILQRSEDLKLRELKNACLVFANANHAEVVQTEKWKRMIKHNPHVAGEVLLTIASFQKRNVF